MEKLFQAKLITDQQIVKAVQDTHPGSNRQAIIELFPEIPVKVVTSKLRQAVLKKIIIGCASDVCARAGKNGCGESYRVAEVVG